MRSTIFFFGVLFSVSTESFAQIEGDVVDSKNKAVSGAVIIAIDSTTNVSDTVKSDERGFYYFTALKPGKYKVSVSAKGFISAVLHIKINAAPPGANDKDDTYYAETLDIVLTREKVTK